MIHLSRREARFDKPSTLGLSSRILRAAQELPHPVRHKSMGLENINEHT